MDLLPPHVYRYRPFVTEDYIFGFVGASSKYCVESFSQLEDSPTFFE
jgi:hypothetical protein